MMEKNVNDEALTLFCSRVVDALMAIDGEYAGNHSVGSFTVTDPWGSPVVTMEWDDNDGKWKVS